MGIFFQVYNFVRTSNTEPDFVEWIEFCEAVNRNGDKVLFKTCIDFMIQLIKNSTNPLDSFRKCIQNATSNNRDLMIAKCISVKIGLQNFDWFQVVYESFKDKDLNFLVNCMFAFKPDKVSEVNNQKETDLLILILQLKEKKLKVNFENLVDLAFELDMISTGTLLCAVKKANKKLVSVASACLNVEDKLKEYAVAWKLDQSIDILMEMFKCLSKINKQKADEMFFILLKNKPSENQLSVALSSFMKSTCDLNLLMFLRNCLQNKGLFEPEFLLHKIGPYPKVLNKDHEESIESQLHLLDRLYDNNQHYEILDILVSIIKLKKIDECIVIRRFLDSAHSVRTLSDRWILKMFETIDNIFNCKWSQAYECITVALLMNSDAQSAKAILDIVQNDWLKESFFQHLLLHDPLKHNIMKMDFQVSSFEFTRDRLCMTPDLRMLKKSDEKIKIAFKRKEIEAVFYYLDLAGAGSSILSIISCFLSSVIFIVELMKKSVDFNEMIALKSLLFKISTIVYQFTHNSLPSLKLYSNRTIFAALCETSKLIEEKFDTTFIFEVEELDHVSTLLVAILDLSRICPIFSAPLFYSYESVYCIFTLQKAFDSSMKTLNQTGGNTNRILSKHILAYYTFEGKLKGWYDDDEKEDTEDIVAERLHQSKLDSMLESLKYYNWSLDSVKMSLNWMKIPKTHDGWYLDGKHCLNFDNENQKYKTFCGFTIDLDSGEIKFIMEKSQHEATSFFDQNDIDEIFENKISHTFFSLDQVDSIHHMFPFQKMRYEKSIKDTDYLMSMLHADYLLKFLTTGVEVSSSFPFYSRKTSEGLLKRLPVHLKDILKPLHEEEDYLSSGKAHRFWIETGDIEFTTKYVQNSVTFYFGDVDVSVKKHLLELDEHGNFVDAKNDDDNSPEAIFAKKFTKNYDSIGEYFPELKRLKELVKIAAAQTIINGKIKAIEEIFNDKDGVYASVKATCDNLSNLIEIWPGRFEYYRKVESILDEMINEYERTNRTILWDHEKEEAKNQSRASVKSNLNKLIIDQLSEYLHKSFKIPVSSKHQLETVLKQYLTNNTFEYYSLELVKLLYNFKLEEYRKLIDNLKNNLPQSDVEKDSISKSDWVPSAILNSQSRIVYGGVHLPIRLKEAAGMRNVMNSLMETVGAKKSHSGSWSKTKSQFKMLSASDPKVDSVIRSWLNQEYKNRGSWYKVRNPPGYDIDHTRNHVAFCRWETASANRSTSPDGERLRTAAQPPNEGIIRTLFNKLFN